MEVPASRQGLADMASHCELLARERTWHIDHRVPCAKFDLTKKEEQEKCFHYTNLQPLWAKDNLTKGSKYDDNLLNES